MKRDLCQTIRTGSVLALGDARYTVMGLRGSGENLEARLDRYGWVSVARFEHYGWRLVCAAALLGAAGTMNEGNRTR